MLSTTLISMSHSSHNHVHPIPTKRCWIFMLDIWMMFTLRRHGTWSYTMQSQAFTSPLTYASLANAYRWWTSLIDTTCLQLESMGNLTQNCSQVPHGRISFRLNLRVTHINSCMTWTRTTASLPLWAWWEITMLPGKFQAWPNITSWFPWTRGKTRS